VLAAPAHALTIQDLVDGATFTTANGLSFGDFEAPTAGNLAIDLDTILVDVLEDGFALRGLPRAADGLWGEILLSYSVETISGLDEITEASLLALNVASGTGAQAAVDEFLDSGLLAVLSTIDTGAVPGDAITFDSAIFAAVSQIDVLKAIFLDSAGPGGSARISLIEQRFAVIPEPATVGLLSIGLVGLAAMGRHRRTR
jgi:hypothetical protein